MIFIAVLKQRPFVSSALSHCTHVFVRQDAVRRTLEQPYYGPHKVVERRAKTFTVDINGKQEEISLDYLKPAHIEDSVTMDVNNYQGYSLASFSSCINSIAHNEDNKVRTTCSLT